MLKFFDAHCHLTNTNVPEYMGCINNAARISDWGAVIQSTRHPNVYGAIGIHPWYVLGLPAGWDMQMYELLRDNPELMVGEIGLHKGRTDIETQTSVFVRQLEIAIELKRGVHIHCVGMWDTMRRILDSFGPKQPPFILFHRFSGQISDIANIAERYNAFFSYRGDVDTGRITNTPLHRILVESDTDNVQNVIVAAHNIAAQYNMDEATFVNNAIRMLNNE